MQAKQMFQDYVNEAFLNRKDEWEYEWYLLLQHAKKTFGEEFVTTIDFKKSIAVLPNINPIMPKEYITTLKIPNPLDDSFIDITFTERENNTMLMGIFNTKSKSITYRDFDLVMSNENNADEFLSFIARYAVKLDTERIYNTYFKLP